MIQIGLQIRDLLLVFQAGLQSTLAVGGVPHEIRRRCDGDTMEQERHGHRSQARKDQHAFNVAGPG